MRTHAPAHVHSVGVGFDTKGAEPGGSHKKKRIVVKGVNKKKPVVGFEIPDSREGWVKSVGMLIDAYFEGNEQLVCVFCVRVCVRALVCVCV